MNVRSWNRLTLYSGMVVLAELWLAFQTTNVVAFNVRMFSEMLSTDVPPHFGSCGHNPRQSTFSLYTSLTVPPGTCAADFDEDDTDSLKNKETKRKEKNHGIAIEKYQDRHQENDEENGVNVVEGSDETTDLNTEMDSSQPPLKRDPFLLYLLGMVRHIRNPAVLANRLDDELKRMENRYFNLVGDDIPTMRYPLAVESRVYNRKPRRPSPKVYELVAEAYSKADLGGLGPLMAEDVLARFQKHNPDLRPSTELLSHVMKAWIAAGNIEKSDYWLRRIEEQCQQGNDRPGYQVYHPFILGLQKMGSQDPKWAADRTMKIIEVMRESIEGIDDDVQGTHLPSNITYKAAMKLLRRSPYTGFHLFDRMEKLMRYQLEDFRRYGRKISAWNAVQGLSPFIAARRCTFPRDYRVVQRCEILLNDYHQVYKKSGNTSLRPDPEVYSCMLTIYSYDNPRKKARQFATKTLSILQHMKEMGVQLEQPSSGTAAINRIIEIAESRMPVDPLKKPERTRNLFEICLDAFKKCHDGDDALASPDSVTYETFLRACSKLPQGDSRSKLTCKAFQLCKKNGLVTMGVGKELYNANPELANNEFGVTSLSFFDGPVNIPEEWGINAIRTGHHKTEPEIIHLGFHRIEGESNDLTMNE